MQLLHLKWRRKQYYFSTGTTRGFQAIVNLILTQQNYKGTKTKRELIIYPLLRWLSRIYPYSQCNCLYTLHLVGSLIKYLVCNIILISIVFPFWPRENIWIALVRLHAASTRLGPTLPHLGSHQTGGCRGRVYLTVSQACTTVLWLLVILSCVVVVVCMHQC